MQNVIQRYLLDVNIALLAFRVIRRQVHVSMVTIPCWFVEINALLAY